MVSDFLEEVGGLLEFEGEKARLQLEHQTDGYFTNDMLIVQVDKAIDIFEEKYPTAIGLFIFDHAPSHMKKPEDALNADRLNVKDGGKQPFMKDTTWNGVLQRGRWGAEGDEDSTGGKGGRYTWDECAETEGRAATI